MTDLSTAALSAVTAVALDHDQRRAWFEALCTLPDGSTVDSLTTADLPAPAVDELLRVLAEDPDPEGTLAELRAAGPEVLEQAYLAATAEDSTEVDEHAWDEFLRSHGARWSREEETWPAFREWFLFEADQRGLGEPARQFAEYAEGRDKAQTFDEYQVPRPAAAAPAAPDVSAYPAVTEGDQGDWVAYANQLLTRAGY
jgi:hypothetical protein